MTTFVRHDNEILIPTPGPPFQWNLVELSGLLVNSNAIGVITRYRTSAGVTIVQTRETGTTPDLLSNKLIAEMYYTWATSLKGGTTIETRIDLDPTTPIELFLIGEILPDDGAVLHDAPPTIPLVEPWLTWSDFQPTPIDGDVLADIGAVIIRSIGAGGQLGFRERASVDIEWSARWEGGASWWIIGLDSNGFYQAFTGGKTNGNAFNILHEVGYIKKSPANIVTILNPIDMGLPVQLNFGVMDFTGLVPADTKVVGGRMGNFSTPTNTALRGYARNKNSADDTHIDIQKGNTVSRHNQHLHMNLGADLQAEYETQEAQVDYAITWYERPSGQLIPDTPGVIEFESKSLQNVSFEPASL